MTTTLSPLLLTWGGTAVLTMILTAFGRVLTDRCNISTASPTARVLNSAGVGFAALAAAGWLLGILAWLTTSAVVTVLAIFVLIGGFEGPRLVAADLVLSYRRSRLVIGEQSWRWLAMTGLASLVILDALVATAPLTGSDAMHYHFTVPQLWAEHGKIFEIPSIANSYFTGLGHALIATGLVLAGAPLAQGIIFLGGMLTAAIVFKIAHRLSGIDLALLTTAVFLATPMVYWQSAVAGSPDIWIGYFLLLALLLIDETAVIPAGGKLALAGLFIGTAAGMKYSALVLIPILAVVAICHPPRAPRLGYFLLPAIMLAALPYVRNFFWTGEPFFPFALGSANPATLDSYTYAAVYNDTHAPDFDRSMLGLVSYPVMLVVRGAVFGAGQFFGPLILAFSPLCLLFIRGASFFLRSAVLITVLYFFANALTSQMARHLLPTYPIALVIVMAGIGELKRRGYHAALLGARLTVVVFLLFGATTNVLYARDFIPVALGRESDQAFLTRLAPDYNIIGAAATVVPKNGKALTFFRHGYYTPFRWINGDPATSWLINQKTMTHPAELTALLQSLAIQYVVKSPAYPPPLQAAFSALEQAGTVKHFATVAADNFSGMRIERQRQSLKIEIMQLRLPRDDRSSAR